MSRIPYEGYSMDTMVQAYVAQYLAARGWIRSVEARAPMDRSGQPLPWFTYPAISFLERATAAGMKVFEYGCGHSTLWWERRGLEVQAVDHDPEWVERISSLAQCRDSVRLRAPDAPSAEPVELAGYLRDHPDPPAGANRDQLLRSGQLNAPFRAYAAEILRFPAGHFDVVVVDGMARNLTTWLAVRYAQPRRFVVFDNSDREAYAEAYAELRDAGYRRIDFWGSGPINPYEWCTSVFCRDLAALP